MKKSINNVSFAITQKKSVSKSFRLSPTINEMIQELSIDLEMSESDIVTVAIMEMAHKYHENY